MRNADKNFRLLLLGAGAVVSEYYLPALDALGWTEGLWIADQNPDRLCALKKDYPAIHVLYGDYPEALKKIDPACAVVIALPNALHFQACHMAIERRLSVLCEKPLTMSAAQCEILGVLAQKHQQVLRVGMARRFLPCFEALKMAMASPLFGEIEKIEVEIGGKYAWLADSAAIFKSENGGILTDMGVHYLDLIQLLVGDVIPSRYEDDSYGGVEANCEYHLKTKDDKPVMLRLSRTHDLKNKFQIFTNKGILFFKQEQFENAFFLPRQDNFCVSICSKEQHYYRAKTPSLSTSFAEQFIRFYRILEGENEAMADAFSAAKIMGLIEWAYKNKTPKAPLLKTAGSGIGKTSSFSEQDKIMITGGTGFIGQALISNLWDRGMRNIHIPVRSYRTCADIARYPVHLKRVNILDKKAVKDFVRGSRFVVHLAYGKDGGDQREINIEGTKNVVNAAIEAQAESIVILSTMYVFGNSDRDVEIDESGVYRPAGGVYGHSKVIMEKWCLARARTAGKTRIVVLNPSCVFGPKGATYTTLPVELTIKGQFCFVDGGSGVGNYTYIDNLVDAICNAMVIPEAQGERFIINDGNCSWYEFLSPLLKPCNRDIPFLSSAKLSSFRPMPRKLSDSFVALLNNYDFLQTLNCLPGVGVCKAIVRHSMPEKLREINRARFLKNKQALLAAEPSFSVPPTWLVDLFGPGKARFSSAKAAKILQWQPKINFNDAMVRTVQWLAQSGYYKNNKTL